MTQPDGGPAFPTMYPVPIVDGEGHVIRIEFPHPEGQQKGMSLRDWFAGLALQGLLPTDSYKMTLDELVALSFKAADAMLRQREAAP